MSSVLEPLGIVEDTIATSLTIPGLTVTQGATLRAAIALDTSMGGVTSVAWNGHALSLVTARIYGASSSLRVYKYDNATGGTGNLTVTFNNPVNACMLASMGLGVISAPLDASASAAGSSTSPNSGATPSTVQANELVWGVVAMENVSSVGGSWDNSFTDGQSVGTGLSQHAISEGWKHVTSTGAQTASKTGATDAGWAAVVETFKDGTGFIVTATAAGGGTVSPSGPVLVASGGTQVFNFTPAAYHAISDVKLDGVSQGTPASLTLTNVLAEHTVAVTFVQLTNTITASAGANGSISPPGVTTVNQGGGPTAYTITPATNYVVQDVLVDGVSVGAVTTYTFNSPITTNHTISATFASSSPGAAIIGQAAVVPMMYHHMRR